MIGGNHHHHKRKRSRKCVEKESLISKLPEHLIDYILERLPVKDAVRTSVLSRNWRYRWTKMRSLILDEHLSEKLAKKGGAFGSNGFIRIANQLFNFLEGPISNVHLHIPKEMLLDSFQEVNQWIFSLSRKHHVRELVFTNSNQPYQLPSYLFRCSELRKLHLKNSIFKPPSLEFHGFLHLKDLSLTEIAFEANLLPIKLPQLNNLELVHCTNVYNFNITATKNLTRLRVVGCRDAMFSRLLHNQRYLTEVELFTIKPVLPRGVEERVNLATMLTNLPYLVILSVDDHFLKFCSAVEKIPKWLPRAADRLESLYFVNCNYGDLDQLQGALFMLRNSPNLEQLCVMTMGHLNLEHMHLDVKPALAYLEASHCFDQTLKRLKTLEIGFIAGSRPFLLLIKLLLAHCPTIDVISITASVKANPREKCNFYRDLILFPRASSKAKFYFMDHQP